MFSIMDFGLGLPKNVTNLGSEAVYVPGCTEKWVGVHLYQIGSEVATNQDVIYLFNSHIQTVIQSIKQTKHSTQTVIQSVTQFKHSAQIVIQSIKQIKHSLQTE